MRTCPNCTTELVIDGGERCPVCNATLSTAPDCAAGSADDDLPFDITEAHDDQRELIGGSGRKSRRNDLGIENEADITAAQYKKNEASGKSDERRQSLDDELVQMPLSASPSPIQPPQQSTTDPHNAVENSKSGVSRLSDKEIQSISKNLYGNQSYLNEREKVNLLKKIDPNARSNQHDQDIHETAESDGTRPRMAKRVRGIAWYYHNWIQVVGDHNMHEQDEIVINDRSYVLRKKRFSPKVTIAALSPIAAVLLFFIGSALTPSTSGNGRIVGFVLDHNGQPIMQSATVRLPDLGQSVTTNAQGFFVSDPIKSGSHKIEYVVNGNVIGSDYATVVSDEITTLKLTPSSVQSVATTETSPQPQAEPRELPVRPSDVMANRSEQKASPRSSQTRSAENNGNNEQGTADPDARLLLDADIEGATLSLNDRIVGAGNLTFARLKPGKYDYQVSKEGYTTAKGSVELTAGKTTSLAVQLPQLRKQQKPSAPAEEQHYEAAMAAFKDNDFATAEKEFALAIEAKPSYAQAYLGSADLKTKTGHPTQASQDYLRAAEIYRIAGDLGNALKAYNGAVKTDKSSPAALQGRGNLYLSRGEQIAAIADFEQLITIDRRNPQAYYGLGLARFSQGNPKQAIKHFKDARSIDPQNPDIHEYLMLCYFATDNFKDAKHSYEDFVEVANDAQVKDLKKNPKFGAVLRVVQD